MLVEVDGPVSYSPAGLALGKHIQRVCCKHGKDATGASLAGRTPCSLRTAASCSLNVNAMHTCCARCNARRPRSGRRVHMCLAQRTPQRRASPGASYFGGASTGCVLPFACTVKYTLTALPRVCRSLRTHCSCNVCSRIACNRGIFGSYISSGNNKCETLLPAGQAACPRLFAQGAPCPCSSS